ncbi:MAG TPA: hypothetical protein VFH05_13130, partial [Nitrospira sp.]|nr:hypothetical protein [Nitrospira sp.]
MLVEAMQSSYPYFAHQHRFRGYAGGWDHCVLVQKLLSSPTPASKRRDASTGPVSDPAVAIIPLWHV